MMLNRKLYIVTALMAMIVLMISPLGEAFSGSRALAAQEDDVIVVEAENYVTTNVEWKNRSSPLVEDPEASAGMYLRLETDQTPPPGGYVSEYTVEAPQEGLYRLDALTQIIGKPWSSLFDYSVNSGDYVTVSSPEVLENPRTNFNLSALGIVHLQEGPNTIRFRVNQTRPLDLKFYVLWLDMFRLTPVPLALSSITADAPLHVFEYGDPLKFHIHLNGLSPVDVSVSYNVYSYDNQLVTTSETLIPTGTDQVEVNLSSLPKGHYRITAVASDFYSSVTENFGIVTPLAERPQLVETPFAMDTAVSWLIPQHKLEDYVKVLQLTGITWIRDRFRWGSVNPQPGVYDFSAYDPFIDELSDAGFQILDVYHNAPSWTIDNSLSQFPSDPMHIYDFARESAIHYGSKVDVWEVWNEPNLPHGRNHTPDQYASLLKVAAIGYHDANVGARVSMAGYGGVVGTYAHKLYQNEIFPYIDVVNFHGYPDYKAGPITTPFPEHIVDSHRDLVELYEGEDKDFWMSEAGLAIPVLNFADLTYEEQVHHARYLVTSTVTSLSQGVDKHFFFVAANYWESGRNYGIFSNNLTPYAAYVAETVLTEALGEGIYAGIVEGLPNHVTGHRFLDRGHQVLTLWSDVSEPVELELGQTTATLIDIMGLRQTLNSPTGTYTIEVGKDPVYIRVPVSANRGGNRPFPTRDAQPSVSSVASLSEAERVVLYQDYPISSRPDSQMNGYMLSPDEPNVLKVHVMNLNPTPMQGTIEGAAYGGWTLSDTSVPVSIAPFDKEILQFTLSATEQVLPGQQAQVVFKGTFAGNETTDSVAFVTTPQAVVTIEEEVPGFTDPNNWGFLLAPQGTGVVSVGPEPGSVQFKYGFEGQGDWGFAQIMLPQGADYSSYSGLALMVYAEEDFPQTIMRLLIKESDEGQYFTKTGFAIRQGWNQIKVPFDQLDVQFADPDNSLDLDELHSIFVGINYGTTDVPPFAIKDFGFYSETTVPLSPALADLNPGHGTTIPDSRRELIATFADHGGVGIDPQSIRVELNGSQSPFNYDPATRKLKVMTPRLNAGEYTLTIYARDQANAPSKFSSTFTVTPR